MHLLPVKNARKPSRSQLATHPSCIPSGPKRRLNRSTMRHRQEQHGRNRPTMPGAGHPTATTIVAGINTPQTKMARVTIVATINNQ